MMRLFERALARAEWPLAWSDLAYNPRPQLVFALPVGCGIENRYEPFELELTEKIDLDAAVSRLNLCLPDGLSIRHAVYTESGRKKSIMSLVEKAEYEFIGSGVGAAYESVFSGEPVIISKKRKGKTREVDLSAQIFETKSVSADQIRLISTAGSQDNMRPDSLIQALQEAGVLSEKAANNIQVIRHAVYLSDERA